MLQIPLEIRTHFTAWQHTCYSFCFPQYIKLESNISFSKCVLAKIHHKHCKIILIFADICSILNLWKSHYDVQWIFLKHTCSSVAKMPFARFRPWRLGGSGESATITAWHVTGTRNGGATRSQHWFPGQPTLLSSATRMEAAYELVKTCSNAEPRPAILVNKRSTTFHILLIVNLSSREQCFLLLEWKYMPYCVQYKKIRRG